MYLKTNQAKKLNRFFTVSLSMGCFLLLFFCAPGPSQSNRQRAEKSFEQYTSLIQALRSIAGVQVSGSESSPNIILRGGGTGGVSNIQPLFVVDNVIIGTSYAQANSVVVPSNIQSIRILNGVAATTKYGQEGRGGVILIRTKSSKDK